MYLFGSFLNQAGQEIRVTILTNNKRAPRVEIGSEESGIYFTTDPIEIRSSVNDLADPLLRCGASIRLQTRSFIPELFCPSALNAVVNIFRDGECVFAGYLEPQTYDQDFNSLLDDLEVNCIDALSALQYSKYRNAGTPGHPYAAIKSSADQVSFRTIIDNTLATTIGSLNIDGAAKPCVYYDGSRALDGFTDPYSMLDDISASELVFLGDDEDDVRTQEEALEAVMKYLNLHIVQRGMDFYIFSWERIKQGSKITWKAGANGETVEESPRIIAISTPLAADCGTTISIDEVFNQVKLRCNIETVENVIESPLDSSSVSSPFSNRQKYVTEYAADGNGKTSYEVFAGMIKGEEPIYDGATIRDWYVQVQDNPGWEFRMSNMSQTNMEDVTRYFEGNANQQDLPNDLAMYQGAALLSLGKVEHKLDGKDNSPISKVDMTDFLVVSVNGNGIDGTGMYPTESALKASCPRAVYKGTVSGGIFSPSNSSTTNYIVISGKMVLNPLMYMTAPYSTLYSAGLPESNAYWHTTVPSRTNSDGRYYTRKYYKASNPNAVPQWQYNTPEGLIPFSDDPYSQARKDAVDFVLNVNYGTTTLYKEAFKLGKVAAE